MRNRLPIIAGLALAILALPALAGALTMDNRVVPAGAVTGDWFGSAVDASSEIVAFGSPYWGNVAGAVAIYSSDGTNEVIVQPSDISDGAQFGSSVAVDGTRVVVGAIGTGAVYVFDETSPGQWTQTARLTISGGRDALFGYSVDVEGDQVLVGAQTDGTHGRRAGAAHLFTHVAGSWDLQTFYASDAVSDDRFGRAVALGADRVVVAAPWTGHIADNAGTVYVYTNDGSGWQEDRIEGQSMDGFFGASIESVSDGLAIGTDATGAGAAYFAQATPSGWELADLPWPNGQPGDSYGHSVDAVDGRIVVGARYADAGGALNSGAVMLWQRDAAGSWVGELILPAGMREAREEFGTDVAVTATGVAIGAPGEDGYVGAGYVFNADADGDGIADETDNCPAIANPDQTDTDNDGIGDECDPLTDTDNDGIADDTDNCPAIANPDQTDTDNDGIGDECDPLTDTDNDGIADDTDNCPAIANPDQTDTDNDGIGDECDPLTDTDNDGIADDTDNCPAIANPDQTDSDGDGEGDLCDATPVPLPDGDGDGIADEVDNCPAVANPDQTDSDGNGVGDLCDVKPDPDPVPVPVLDTDGDGIPDDVDEYPFDNDNDSVNDVDDLCPNTEIPDPTVPVQDLGRGRWAMVDDDFDFEFVPYHNDRAPRRTVTIQDTGGCNAGQIIEALGLGKGHTEFGLSFGALREWVHLHVGNTTMFNPKR